MDIDINRAWEVNPYDASAYGAIVVLLLVSIIYLAKQLTNKEKETKVLYEKLHNITDILGDKLNEIKQLTDMNNEKNIGFKEKIMYILEDIKTKLIKIEDGNHKNNN